MTHQLAFDHETATDAVFACAMCGEVIGFNKQGIGEPCATQVNGVWVPPANYNEWMKPTCP